MALAFVLCLPALTVAWLGSRLLEQDRALERQRLAESRELAAGQAVQRMSALLADPALFDKEPGAGALLARFPNPALLFRDAAPLLPEPEVEAFQEGEILEFRENDAAAAATIYARLAEARSPLLRAGALFRLGRTLDKSGRPEDALRAFGLLGSLEGAAAGGWPAPIASAWSRCRIFESKRDAANLRIEAESLLRLLQSGRYPMSRAAYAAFAEDAERWTGQPRPLELERLTEAVLQVESSVRDGRWPPAGRALLLAASAPVTVAWSSLRGQRAVFAATQEYVLKQWVAPSGPGVWLRDDRGGNIGAAMPGPAAVRYAAETKLPWTVVAAPPLQNGELGARRRLLLILLAAVGFFTISGAYVVFRSLRREFALARMQEDFVAAVSHEFRTPLTTLRQISESLEDGRVASEEKRAHYYRSLSRATQRLHRLVEDVLDFRRMQSGALEYRRTRMETREFTARIAADFQQEVEDRGFRVQVSPGPPAVVLADAEALRRAVWNLLDNAVKYSGTARSVELTVACRNRAVEWSVRDQGPGIPPQERSLIFQRFFRGDAARREGIRGTGIGLAMVQQIAAAHGGRVSMDSEVGVGSTFTLSIPCGEKSCNES